jgi:class 3 adenylate cyclase
MKYFDRLADGETTQALIGVSDLARFAQVARQESPQGLLALVRKLAETASAVIEPTSGQIIKYIGDAVLAAFPPEAADEGVRALAELRKRLLDALAVRGIGVTVSAHFGEVIVARLEPFTAVDVLGEAVNTTFLVDRRSYRGSLVITPQAFRKLAPATRARFHKHTPPIAYVADDAGERGAQ